MTNVLSMNVYADVSKRIGPCKLGIPDGYTVRMRNRTKHVTWDGCMYTDDEMFDPKTWENIIDVLTASVCNLVAHGLSSDQAPAIHFATWQAHVGRGEDSELGEVIPFDTMLDQLIAAKGSNGEKINGIDLMEGPCVDVDMPDEDFAALVKKLKDNDLVIGDIVAMIWGTEGAFGSETARQRMVNAVERACKLARRFEKAGVRSYGRIRIDAADGPHNFGRNTELNYPLLVDTFKRMADAAKVFSMDVVAEGEASFAMLNGHRNVLQLFRDVGRDNIFFQADLAHLVHFLAGQNGHSEDRLLPEHAVPRVPNQDDLLVDPLARQATADEMLAGFAILGAMLGPVTGSLHAAQSVGAIFGAGDHDPTGQHVTAHNENGVVNVIAVLPAFALELVVAA